MPPAARTVSPPRVGKSRVKDEGERKRATKGATREKGDLATSRILLFPEHVPIFSSSFSFTS